MESLLVRACKILRSSVGSSSPDKVECDTLAQLATGRLIKDDKTRMLSASEPRNTE